MKSQLYFIIVILCALRLSPAMAAHSTAKRNPSVAPSPSPTQSADDLKFLELPALDLEPIAPSSTQNQAATGGTYHVGDQIRLSAPAIEGATGPLSVELPHENSEGSGGTSLEDQGWVIGALPTANTPTIFVVPLKAGKLTLPSLEIKDSAQKAVARTNPWLADVVTAIRQDDPEPQKPADLRPPMGLVFPWWVIVTLAVLGVILLAVLIYFIVRWSRNRKSNIPVIQGPPKSEDEQALEAFAKLEKAQLVIKGDYKKYCFRISEILKAYIGARYGFDAPERTTKEMLQELEQLSSREPSLDRNHLRVLGDLFAQLDLVKFTDQVPGQIEALQFLPTGRDFVTETRKRIITGPPSTDKRTGGGTK